MQLALLLAKSPSLTHHWSRAHQHHPRLGVFLVWVGTRNGALGELLYGAMGRSGGEGALLPLLKTARAAQHIGL